MISIIVPVYKVEQYLRQCIESILNQTYQNLEIILIDDGSPDRCGDICEEYARNDCRIRVFHTKNNGLSAARNLGLREAKGEYIGFVDSDDWIAPNMYETLLRQLEESQTDIAACAVLCEHMDGRHIYSDHKELCAGVESIRVLIYKISNAVWNKLYKRECWTGIEFPEGCLYEDITTIYKVFLNAKTVLCISNPLYHYRQRKESISHSQLMQKYIDYWAAVYGRSQYLCTLSEIRKDQKITDELEKQVAKAAAMIWRGIYSIPKKQRDYDFLRMVSVLVRTRHLFFGKKDWKLYLRTCFFFSRYANDISFFILYALTNIYKLFYHKNKQNHLFYGETRKRCSHKEGFLRQIKISIHRKQSFTIP